MFARTLRAPSYIGLTTYLIVLFSPFKNFQPRLWCILLRIIKPQIRDLFDVNQIEGKSLKGYMAHFLWHHHQNPLM